MFALSKNSDIPKHTKMFVLPSKKYANTNILLHILSKSDRITHYNGFSVISREV